MQYAGNQDKVIPAGKLSLHGAIGCDKVITEGVIGKTGIHPYFDDSTGRANCSEVTFSYTSGDGSPSSSVHNEFGLDSSADHVSARNYHWSGVQDSLVDGRKVTQGIVVENGFQSYVDDPSGMRLKVKKVLAALLAFPGSQAQSLGRTPRTAGMEAARPAWPCFDFVVQLAVRR